MKFDMVRLSQAEGCYLAHTLQTAESTIKKGSLLTRADIDNLAQAGVEQVLAGTLEDDEIDENEAARFLAPYLTYDFHVSPVATGRVNFHAPVAGLFEVDKVAVDGFNTIDPALTLATIQPDVAVSNDEMVATLKIIPMAVKKQLLDQAVGYLKKQRLYQLLPFASYKVSLFETVLREKKVSVRKKNIDVLNRRLALSQSRLVNVEAVPHDATMLADALRRIADKATSQKQLFIIYGASAVIDENDVIPSAIRKAGGTVIRMGMPVEPGNLLVLGQIGDIVVIGAPGCSRSIAFNGFDIVLHRLLAGKPINAPILAAMGVGGLLNSQKAQLRVQKEIACRDVRVAAMILAAGSSTRIGNPDRHKLLAHLDGEVLIHRVASAVIESKCAPTVLVTGCRHQEIAAAVENLNIHIVMNPLYQEGMACSIIAGVNAIDLAHVEGIMIVLGDMPAITTEMIDQLVDTFRAQKGQAIVRAVFGAKRGNPVILPKIMRDELLQLRGDVGARALIEKADLPVIDIDIGEAAHVDVDTAEAMKKIGAVFNA